MILDFEKPVYDLEEKLAEMENLSSESKMDASSEFKILSKKLEETKKEIYKNLTSNQKVQLARHPDRPYTLDYIKLIFTDFIELHGDRRFADDQAIIGGFAKLDGKKVMIIGSQKGRDTADNLKRNFGYAHPEGYRKAMRLMRLAEKANAPIITLIDTPGAYPGIASEERHVGEAIATNLKEMFDIKVPIIAIVIGEGGSGGALGIGVGNRIMILENSYYSVITPEGCAAILWKDRSRSPEAAEALKITADKLQELGIADAIVPEPLGGAHRDYEKAAENLKVEMKKMLKNFEKLSEKQIKDDRYEKFRKIAVFA
jgi:acetyl-CoA carboxylase carboxyl transferase subunit alpha